MATRLPDAEKRRQREGPNEEKSKPAMSLGSAHQKSGSTELALENRGEAPKAQSSGEARPATRGNGGSGNDGALMERVVERDNVKLALKRVRQNKGSPGVDGMTVDELPAWLNENYDELKKQLLNGTYEPREVREQKIPKAGGGVRTLGIPTVIDRLIQQAMLNVLQPRFDPTFSESSYGFRPGRGAHDAVRAAQKYIQSGKSWVVDVDLEKFFDRVNHDVLMSRLEHRISDKRMLGLIRRYLNADILADGVSVERHEGTPQGGPLSPLLANVLLDEVDKELEQRGHSFARYADDCNVYVRSRRAGERVMAALKVMYAGLHLRVNEAKSAVDYAWNRKFLGYRFWTAPGRTVKFRVAPESLEAMKQKVRQVTSRNGGRSLAKVVAELATYLTGWKNYFKLVTAGHRFRELDKWIRHRVRQVQVKQWKRGTTAYRELRSRGVDERNAREAAANIRRWWAVSMLRGVEAALPASEFDRLGIPRLYA